MAIIMMAAIIILFIVFIVFELKTGTKLLLFIEIHKVIPIF